VRERGGELVSGMPRHAWVGIGFVLGWFGSRSPAHSQCAVRACCHAPCRFRNRGARLSRGVCAADASEKWRPRLVGPGVGGWFWAGRRWGGVCRGSFRTLLTDSGRAVRRWGFQFTARMPFVLVLEQLHWALQTEAFKSLLQALLQNMEAQNCYPTPAGISIQTSILRWTPSVGAEYGPDTNQ
jgi:hypothetical protein